MLADYVWLAIGSLRKRRLRSWLTMIGIVLGITVVVGLISLGQGMQRAIEEQFFQLGADKINVQAKGPNTGPPGANSDVQLTTEDLDVLRRTKGVSIATGRLVEPIAVSFNDKERFLYVATLPEDADERKLVMEVANVDDGDMIAGRALKADDRWKVVVSEDYLTRPSFDGESLHVGDRVTINGNTVEVIGIFAKTGNPFIDMSFVMNEQVVRDMLDIPEKYGVLVAQATPGGDIRLLAAAAKKDLRIARELKEGKEDFEVRTAEDVLEAFTSILSIVTGVLVGIAAISLLVGGIGIMNTMYTAVLERTREIGVMKAIGATNGAILSIFLIESGLLGLLGGVIGVLLGMLLSKMVELAATAALGTTLIQASFPWYLILGSLVFSFLVGSIAGVWPASQASKLTPVEALRE